MSKRRKREKNLLNQFKDYTDDMILNTLKYNIPEYIILVESERKAIEILSKYGIIVIESLNQEKKKQILKLIEVAKIRNLTIPNEWYIANVPNCEIILRIEEFKNQETTWIDKHNYIFNLHDPNFSKEEVNDINYNKEEWPSDVEIEKTIKKYDDIIKKEFGEDKFNIFKEDYKQRLIKKLTMPKDRKSK